LKNSVIRMKSTNVGGYDEGYQAVPCFWGTKPGSLVATYLAQHPAGRGARVLDLGCGEGKNAAAFTRAGYVVDAIDCSPIALANGKRAFPDLAIKWREGDARQVELGSDQYRVVVAYGLFHCLRGVDEIAILIGRSKRATAVGGFHIVCTFNDRSQDLTAHAGLDPTLTPHDWYLDQYCDWTILSSSDLDLYETHPHNNIAHRHSMTRLIARRPQ
jgi:tellurite methyltransferase